MAYEKVIFNENSLRSLIRETTRDEAEKMVKNIKGDINKIWEFLNKLKEEVLILTQDLESRNKAKEERFGINKNEKTTRNKDSLF